MLVCRKQESSPKDTTPDRTTVTASGGGPVFLPRRRLSAFAEQLLETAPGQALRYQEEPLLAVGDVA